MVGGEGKAKDEFWHFRRPFWHFGRHPPPLVPKLIQIGSDRGVVLR